MATARAVGSELDDLVEELVTVLLDRLGPTLEAHRRELARRVGLEPSELACVELVRRLGPLPSPTLAARLGLTRSAIAKLVRRLEAAGHVERRIRPGCRQEIEVAWLAVPQRDAVLDELRGRVRRATGALVADLRLDDVARHAQVASGLAAATEMIGRQARRLTDETEDARHLEHRRREHATAPDHRWWER